MGKKSRTVNRLFRDAEKKQRNAFLNEYQTNQAKYDQYVQQCFEQELKSNPAVKNYIEQDARLPSITNCIVRFKLIKDNMLFEIKAKVRFSTFMCSFVRSISYNIPACVDISDAPENCVVRTLKNNIASAICKCFQPVVNLKPNNFEQQKTFLKDIVLLNGEFTGKTPAEAADIVVNKLNEDYVDYLQEQTRKVLEKIMDKKGKMEVRPKQWSVGKPENIKIQFIRRTKNGIDCKTTVDMRYNELKVIPYSCSELFVESFWPLIFEPDFSSELLLKEAVKIVKSNAKNIGKELQVNVTFNCDYDTYILPYNSVIKRISERKFDIYATLKSYYEVDQFKDKKIVWDGRPLVYIYNTYTRVTPIDNQYPEYLNSLKSPYTLRRKNLPDNLYDLETFLVLANRLYREKKPEKIKSLPQLEFVFSKNRIIRYSYMREEYKIAEWEFDENQTVRANLLNLFHQIWEKEAEFESRDIIVAKQIENLNLGKIHIEILKYVYKVGRTWASDLRSDFQMVPMPKKDCLLTYLRDLTRTCVTFAGKEYPLVECDIKRSDSHGKRVDFELYTPSEEIPKEAILNLPDMPLTEKDFDNINPTSRNEWCKEICCKAETKEELWSCLQVIEKLPASALASIAKIPEVQEFFKKFTGEDAVYAAFVLDEAQGCKKLANEMVKVNV